MVAEDFVAIHEEGYSQIRQLGMEGVQVVAR